MNIFEFLLRMENTLSTISVRGKEDIQSMHSCLEAIDNYRQFLLTPPPPTEEKPKEEVTDDGRQSDNGASASDNDHKK